jgi:hypothetical protein
MQNSKWNFRNLANFSCAALFLSIYSCVPFWIPADKFSRTYTADFKSVHPKINSALQDYAKRHKGNSFQIVLLGSDAVIIQGLYKGEQCQARLSTTITVKPAGPGRTRIEIKISSNDAKISSEYLKEAGRELFQIIEKGTGISPRE